jgi:NOL1/NOP2/fmu family ribosome biogenesis protein
MLYTLPEGVYESRGAELHIPPRGYVNHPDIRTIKTGLYLGFETHGKFEPSQSLAMALKWSQIKRKESFSINDADLIRYLRGETLSRFGEKGYIALGVEGYPIGWGKIGENGLKNLYPKGWRRSR